MNQLRDLDYFKTFYWNYLKRNTTKKFYVYKKSVLDIHKTAKINILGSAMFNNEKIKNSKSEGRLKMDEGSVLNILEAFSIYYGSDIRIYKNGALTLGSGFINAGGQIRCAESITIGNGVAIGRNVFIQDSDFHQIYTNDGVLIENTKKIVIGNNVWIGINVTILKGVTIGDGAVVGAGSLVTKNVPKNTVFAGVPGKVIRDKVKWR